MYSFGINSILRQVGETIVVSGITATSYDDYGDPVETESGASVRVSVQEFSAEDEEVIEGVFEASDVEVFVSDGVSDIDKFVQGSRFSWKGTLYEIKEVIKNKGHYRCIASKI